MLLAAGGREAPDLWRERPTDLVMLDIHMPDIDGIELLLRLRALAPALPNIVMSGGDRTGRVDLLGDTLLLGAMTTIPKPFLLHQVLDAVARVLGTDQASETA